MGSVQNNSQDESKFSKVTAKNAKPYFHLKAANHQIIGTSKMYSDITASDNGIGSVMEHGDTPTIKDLS
ncbi:YegP family protein [Shewanella psychromarinicola]|uniref:YegP family protein n=1 Tax=Shewanella psychromarinicola TaxID=2487742 RepID=UPI003FD8EE6C